MEFRDFKCQICQKLNFSRFTKNFESAFVPSIRFWDFFVSACNFIVFALLSDVDKLLLGIVDFFFVSRKLLFLISNNKSDKLVIQFSHVVAVFQLFIEAFLRWIFLPHFQFQIQKWLQIAHNVYYYILSVVLRIGILTRLKLCLKRKNYERSMHE